MVFLTLPYVSLAHICVEESNALRLVFRTQTGEQSSMGFIRGPLLFDLFINDFTYFVVDANLRLYADDTTQYLSNRNPNALEFTL